LLRYKVNKQPLADASLDGLNAAYANTAFIGFPLCTATFGSNSLPTVTLASILTVCALFGLAIMLVEVCLQVEKHPLHLLRNVAQSLFKNPLLTTPVIGAAVNASGWSIPHSLDTFLTLLGNAASPCALVALGLFLAEQRQNAHVKLSAISALVFLKLVLHPALTWVLAKAVFHLEPMQTNIAVVLAALPTGTGPFMLAEFYNREAAITSNTILVSTVISLITVSILLALLGIV
jgi:malonate transporter and related proteins